MPAQDLAFAYLQNKHDQLLDRLSCIERDQRRSRQLRSANSEQTAIESESDAALERLFKGTAQEFAQVRRALDHMDIGHYGICSICEQPISYARLCAVPEATECGACAPKAAAAAEAADALTA